MEEELLNDTRSIKDLLDTLKKKEEKMFKINEADFTKIGNVVKENNPQDLVIKTATTAVRTNGNNIDNVVYGALDSGDFFAWCYGYSVSQQGEWVDTYNNVIVGKSIQQVTDFWGL